MWPFYSARRVDSRKRDWILRKNVQDLPSLRRSILNLLFGKITYNWRQNSLSGHPFCRLKMTLSEELTMYKMYSIFMKKTIFRFDICVLSEVKISEYNNIGAFFDGGEGLRISYVFFRHFSNHKFLVYLLTKTPVRLLLGRRHQNFLSVFGIFCGAPVFHM